MHVLSCAFAAKKCARLSDGACLEDDVLNLMMEADLDGSGTIEFPEFLELMKHKYGNLDIEDDIRYAPRLT